MRLLYDLYVHHFQNHEENLLTGNHSENTILVLIILSFKNLSPK